jgi:hypothetical protein
LTQRALRDALRSRKLDFLLDDLRQTLRLGGLRVGSLGKFCRDL